MKRAVIFISAFVALLCGCILVSHAVSGYYHGNPSFCKLLQPCRKLPFGIVPQIYKGVLPGGQKQFGFRNYFPAESEYLELEDEFYENAPYTSSDAKLTRYFGKMIHIARYGFNDSTLIFETVDSNMVFRTYVVSLAYGGYYDGRQFYELHERKIDTEQAEALWRTMDVRIRLDRRNR